MSLFDDNTIVFSSKHAPMLSKSGTRWLIYRDIPELIKTYVNGNVALDYGCGNGGASTLVLKSCGLNVDGVDIDEELIKAAKHLDPAGKYTTIKSGEIPEVNNHYDLIFASWVIPFISTKDEMLKVFCEFSRCLKIGGVLIFSVGNKGSFNADWLTINVNFEQNKNPYSGCVVKGEFKEQKLVIHNYFWTEEDYQKVMLDAGLKLLRVHGPVGKDSDGYEWVDEKEKSLCDIYVARK